jgi:hypothetical protein
MSSPKSFKDLIKRPRLKLEPQPLKLIPQPILSATELEKKKLHLQQVTKMANLLRCPLCDSQLDGHVSHQVARLQCVSNPDEYSLVQYRNSIIPKIEIARISDELNKYEISYVFQSIDDQEFNIYEVTINKIDLTLPIVHQNKFKKNIFFHTGRKFLPINKNLNTKNLLSKLEIYQIFQ